MKTERWKEPANMKKEKGCIMDISPTEIFRQKEPLEDDLKTGTWEIYENDGKLSGYYRPFYDDKKLSRR